MMKRTVLQEEVRKMRFEEAYEGWNQGRLSQEEAAQLLGMCARSFHRYLVRYEAEGESGLLDRRLEGRFTRGAPADEVLALQERYREQASEACTWKPPSGSGNSRTGKATRLRPKCSNWISSSCSLPRR
jgi:hypothetical protein